MSEPCVFEDRVQVCSRGVCQLALQNRRALTPMAATRVSENNDRRCSARNAPHSNCTSSVVVLYSTPTIQVIDLNALKSAQFGSL